MKAEAVLVLLAVLAIASLCGAPLETPSVKGVASGLRNTA